MNKLSILESKIATIEEVKKKINIWHLKGEKVVFTNGCFDILHPGHIVVLTAAANQGNRLVVAINSDESVKRLKGDSRPINNDEARSMILAAMHFVDAVCIFEEDTPLNVITELTPDVLVKGGDYTIETIVGAKDTLARGGEVVVVPTLDGFSTSNIIKTIKN